MAETASQQISRWRAHADELQSENDALRVKNEALRLQGNELANAINHAPPYFSQSAADHAVARWRELVA